MSSASSPLQQLLNLSHELGVESRDLAILGEGNTSIRLDEDTFLVKASGSSLPTLAEGDVTRCRFEPLLALLEQEGATDQQITQVLLDSRVDASAKKPSVEAMFHAYLLTLPGINAVAHCHPISVNGILCSPRAADFANRRLFPDEIVCCGRRSALVPYVDPGVPLAQAIRLGVQQVQEEEGELPRLLLLQNHGLIAIGGNVAATLATVRMADKAARIFLNAVPLGGPVFLSAADVARIEGRDDEAYRRKALGLA